MRAFVPTLSLSFSLLLSACLAGEIETDEPDVYFDEDTQELVGAPGGAPQDAYACSVTIPSGTKLASGYFTLQSKMYSKRGCAGTFLGVETLYLWNPNQAKLNGVLAANPKLGGTVGGGFTSAPAPTMEVRRNCPDGTPMSYVEGPGLLFDNYSGGYFTCTAGQIGCRDAFGADGTVGSCGKYGATGGSTSPSGYECGATWWEGTKCTAAGLVSFSVPGLRELYAAVMSGNIQAIAVIIGTALGQTALETLGVLPGIDACACVGSDSFGGCGLNLKELIAYVIDRVRGHNNAFCSYDI